MSTSQVDAITRIGQGPWYDHRGALFAESVEDIPGSARPPGGCCEDGMFDELGIYHDGTGDINLDGIANDDDHHTLTGSNENGTYEGASCDDWTSTTSTETPECGFSWPRNASTNHWIVGFRARGCAPGFHITTTGSSGGTIGDGGGYGGFYCFAESL